ncbi:MAG: FAD binding domain-containing protein [Elusimicrobiota bacterium]
MCTKICKPGDLSEAVKILRGGKGKVVPFAGGTTLMLSPAGDVSYIDMEGLGLNYIKREGRTLRVGAMTTISELTESPAVSKLFNGLIVSCAKTIASTPNRNLITVGGNIVGIRPWSAIPGLLLLTDAEIVTAGRKKYDASHFFSTQPKALLGRDIVTEIRIPLAYRNADAEWNKFSLTETDYPLISVGALYSVRNGKIEHIRLVATGLTLLPQRFLDAEKYLSGRELNGENTGVAVKVIRESAAISNDIRATAEYKRELLGVLVTDVLKAKKQSMPR